MEQAGKKDLVVAHAAVRKDELETSVARFAPNAIGHVTVFNQVHLLEEGEVVDHSKPVQAVVDAVTAKLQDINVLVFCSETVANALPEKVRSEFADRIKVLANTAHEPITTILAMLR